SSRAGVVALPTANLDQHSIKQSRDLHDVSRPDPAFRRVVDVDLAWRAKTQFFVVYSVAPGAAGARRGIWQCRHLDFNHGGARGTDNHPARSSDRAVLGRSEGE